MLAEKTHEMNKAGATNCKLTLSDDRDSEASTGILHPANLASAFLKKVAYPFATADMTCFFFFLRAALVVAACSGGLAPKFIAARSIAESEDVRTLKSGTQMVYGQLLVLCRHL